MNKIRRKEIRQVISRLNKLLEGFSLENICDLIADIIEDVELILSDEECYKDNIPENLQNGYRYNDSEYACDYLQDAISELEYIDEEEDEKSIISYINSAIHYLNESI